MKSKETIFQKTYRDYLKEVSQLDLKAVAEKVGADWTGDSATLPLFGRPYRISESGILDPSGKEPSHSVKVVLCLYLILHPVSNPEDDTWVSYKDFRDAAPFADPFHNHAEMGIAKNFTGSLESLKEACFGLGGHEPSIDLNYDLAMKFDALPKVPILLLFNDADDEFPAQCLLLFERRAEKYLDMECIAILGWLLADYLADLLVNPPPGKTGLI